MHAERFLHTLLSPVMHKKRLDTLTLLVDSLLLNKNLSVTGLGRGVALPIQERSCIRRSDRFIGNKLIKSELKAIFEKNVLTLVGLNKKPEIIVDWTHVPNTKFNVLRAAIVAKGRALTLYDEVHSEKSFGKPKTESTFLKRLHALLPKDCKPIIITDAGYRGPWFRQVLALGWNFVGRIRGKNCYHDGTSWSRCTKFAAKANKSGITAGKIKLFKSRSLDVYLCAIKEDTVHQPHQKKYRKKTHCKKNIECYQKAANEPWLLATSLPCKNALQIQRIKKIYKKRMQIEESFRDLKNARYGFGLRQAYSRSKERVQILFLLSMFASLIAWLVGCAAELEKIHYQFQSNSIKNRRIISLCYLGCQVIKRRIKIPDEAIARALKCVWEGVI